MSVCLIPARGGSKRISRKNIRLFNGKPMIAWSIEAARQSGVFDQIIVSTDDHEIADVAAAHGAEVPFVRPENLADDHATTIDVVRHAIDWLETAGRDPDALCCLYATAPFALAEDIRKGRALLETADFALPVTPFEFPIQRAVRLTGDDRLEMFHPEQFNTRSQDLPEAWHDAGQFYWGRTPSWKTATTLFGSQTAAIRVPRWRVQDIDTEDDWTRAEILARILQDRA
ncbi:pseudaminic acid cytidylyltransferase [Silicimonas sp. MF1-12-2]|uniref:pseudaminic acid cytidylyltransferase n=1 Tax=Silicimonas sp. MF1-12-2 TaxID=3384793 RepID=UPI0039B3AA93